MVAIYGTGPKQTLTIRVRVERSWLTTRARRTNAMMADGQLTKQLQSTTTCMILLLVIEINRTLIYWCESNHDWILAQFKADA